MKISYPKAIFAVILCIYFLWIAFNPMQGNFLDLVDLPIHETGHLIFRLFGEFMMIAGGSLFQVIFPAVLSGILSDIGNIIRRRSSSFGLAKVL